MDLKETIENALYSMGKFTTDECSEMAENIHFSIGQEAGHVDAIVNGTKWTSVEDEPLADITIERDGTSITVTYDNYLVGIDMLFAVPLANGEYSICRGYIEDDGSIQESFQSGQNEWWGYSLEDVTYYMQIFNPK